MRIEIEPKLMAYVAFKDPPKGGLFLKTAPNGSIEVKVMDSVVGTVTAWIWVDKEELKKAIEIL